MFIPMKQNKTVADAAPTESTGNSTETQLTESNNIVPAANQTEAIPDALNVSQIESSSDKAEIQLISVSGVVSIGPTGVATAAQLNPPETTVSTSSNVASKKRPSGSEHAAVAPKKKVMATEANSVKVRLDKMFKGYVDLVKNDLEHARTANGNVMREFLACSTAIKTRLERIEQSIVQIAADQRVIAENIGLELGHE